MSSEEREAIVMEISRLNQRLSDIVNKQLYHSQISQAVLARDLSNEIIPPDAVASADISGKGDQEANAE